LQIKRIFTAVDGQGLVMELNHNGRINLINGNNRLAERSSSQANPSGAANGQPERVAFDRKQERANF
jgi:hypothetical protein